MTLSRSNPRAKPRWFALLALVCISLAFAVTAVAALSTSNPPSLPFIADENLADDQPGQKDLSAHAVNFNPATGDLWVAWKWDVTSLSGGNTGDACALFDTDSDSKVNFAVCVTIGGNPAVQLTSVGSPRIYTCGDAKVDRCTSTVTLVPTPGSYQTACSVNQAGFDRSDPFHANQLDTSALCHIALSEVGASAATLINTCSYPSQQPNSDPSDCVLIPRDAFLVITKVATPNEGSFPFHVDGGAAATFTAAGSGSSSQIAIRSDVTHSVREAVPANWAITGTPACTGASGPGSSNGTFNAATATISGIDASPDNIITCTFNDQLQTGTLIVKKLVINDNGGTLEADDFSFQVNAGTLTPFVTDPDVSPSDPLKGKNTLSVSAGTYDITEPAVTGYTTTYSNCDDVAIANGGTATCTITNEDTKASPGGTTVQSWVLKDSINISVIRPGAPDAASTTVVFRLYNAAGCAPAALVGTETDTSIVAGAAATTDGIAVTATGFYYWTAQYSGDQFNNGFTTICGDEITQIQAKDAFGGGRNNLIVPT